jgi:hypothetical protein
MSYAPAISHEVANDLLKAVKLAKPSGHGRARAADIRLLAEVVEDLILLLAPSPKARVLPAKPVRKRNAAIAKIAQKPPRKRGKS